MLPLWMPLTTLSRRSGQWSLFSGMSRAVTLKLHPRRSSPSEDKRIWTTWHRYKVGYVLAVFNFLSSAESNNSIFTFPECVFFSFSDATTWTVSCPSLASSSIRRCCFSLFSVFTELLLFLSSQHPNDVEKVFFVCRSQQFLPDERGFPQLGFRRQRPQVVPGFGLDSRRQSLRRQPRMFLFFS